MKIIEVPIYNEDGSVQVTQLISPEEAQGLLQLAVNILMASGMMAATKKTTQDPQQQLEIPLTVQ